MPKEFEPGMRYQGYSQTQGYDPIKPMDVTPLLRENQKTEQSNMQRMLDQSLQVMQIQAKEEQNALQRQNSMLEIFQNDQVQELQNFSQTLTASIAAYRDFRKEKDIEAGMNLAFVEGLPEATRQEFKASERMAEEAATVSEGVALSLEAEDAPTDIVERARGLSGWKGYGYARGIAQLAGSQYGAFFERVGGELQVEVAPGRYVSLDSAETSSDFAAITAEIRRQYLKNFEGMNLALLNEYLFPNMRQYEGKAAGDFAILQRERAIARRQTEAFDELAGFIQGENSEDGISAAEGFMKTLNTHQYSLGGDRGTARELLVKELTDGLDGMRYNPATVERMIAEQTIMFNGKETTLLKQFPRDFAPLIKKINDAKNREVTLRKNDRDRKIFAFNENLREQLKKQGTPMTEAQLDIVDQEFYDQFGQENSFTQSYRTVEDRDEEAAKAYGMLLVHNKGFVSEAEAARMPASVVYEFRKDDLIREESTVTLSKEDKDRAKKFVNGLSVRIMQSGGNPRGDDLEDLFRDNAYQDFERLYTDYLMTGSAKTAQEAYNMARQAVKEEAETRDSQGKLGGEYVIPFKSDPNTVTANKTRFQNLVKAFPTHESIFTKSDLFETDVNELRKNLERGKLKVPLIFEQVARTIPGVDGFDLASAQYQAHFGERLKAPPVTKQLAEQTPLVQNLLKNYPSPARTHRALLLSQATGGDTNLFLDLVKNKESKAYGEYDAMNTGGEDEGRVAFGSANSKDVLEKPLTQMTLAEVMEVQKDRVWAAGAYQIIPGTLKELVRQLGLDLDAKFDKQMQDSLAMALYRRRVADYGTNPQSLMRGLRLEWVGLQNVENEVLLEAMKSMSPFNQPENVYPGLR